MAERVLLGKSSFERILLRGKKVGREQKWKRLSRPELDDEVNKDVL